MSTYYDEETEEVHVGRIVLTVLGIVALIGALTFASWGIGIFTAPWAGRQNLHRLINDPTNIRFQNDNFYALDADIHADASNLKIEVAQAKAHAAAYPPGSSDPIGANANEQSRLDSVVTGTSAHCQNLVRTYNAKAIDYTSSSFLSHNLPNQEDPGLCATL